LVGKGIPICFMTSTGGGKHHNHIARQKLTWLYQYGLDKHPVAFAMNTLNKADFAQPGSLLIDDRQKVLNAWEKRGGKGILFTRETASITARELTKLSPPSAGEKQ
jgi:hypothetical protein